MVTLRTFLFSILAALTLLSGPGFADDVIAARGAELWYSSRKSKGVSDGEKKLIGKWAGENEQVSWEIFRKEDGTYELVLHEVDGEKSWTDYLRGIWGIRPDGTYYFTDLEMAGADTDFEATAFEEKVVRVSDDEFVTVSDDDDGKPLQSIEKRVAKFEMDLWEEFGSAEAKSP